MDCTVHIDRIDRRRVPWMDLRHAREVEHTVGRNLSQRVLPLRALAGAAVRILRAAVGREAPARPSRVGVVRCVLASLCVA